MQTKDMKKDYEVAVLDPAGNVTAIVLSDVPAAERARAAARLLRLPELHIEQVAFLTAPRCGGEIRLEMMGGEFCGNALRCVGKYLYETGAVRSDCMSVETLGGVKPLRVSVQNGRVTSVAADMGEAKLGETVKIDLGGRETAFLTVDMGNPHCVVFCPRVDGVDVARIGPQFEHAPYFPDRINTEFIRVVNPSTIKMRVWERGSGETLACGTGACAAVVAAVANGLCEKGRDITVRVQGGDLVVHYTDEAVTLTGDAKLVYTGVVEY